ncbi:MAG: hypothetical protein V4682_03310 [Patescibacteria group bacterium]
MNHKDQATERRGILQLVGTAAAVVLVYYIGKQNADDTRFLLLGAAALVLGVVLGCMTWPPSETGRHFTPLRAFVAGFASLFVIVLAAVIGHFLPEHSFVAPIFIGAGLLLVMHVQAP